MNGPFLGWKVTGWSATGISFEVPGVLIHCQWKVNVICLGVDTKGCGTGCENVYGMQEQRYFTPIMQNPGETTLGILYLVSLLVRISSGFPKSDSTVGATPILPQTGFHTPWIDGGSNSFEYSVEVSPG